MGVINGIVSQNMAIAGEGEIGREYKVQSFSEVNAFVSQGGCGEVRSHQADVMTVVYQSLGLTESYRA